MLMAAGLGTRLRPFTDLAPKPFLPVLGIPSIQFAVDELARAKVQNVVINIHHLPEQAREGIRRLDLHGMSVQVSDESGLLLGSAGGIRKALSSFGGRPFFLFNSDIVCSIDLAALARHHGLLRARHGAALTLAVFPQSPAGEKYREILVDPSSGLIRALGEPGYSKPFYAGVAVIEPEAVQGVPPEGPAEFVPTILSPAVAAGRAGFFPADGIWHDIGSPTLWMRTHFELISRLESGRMPTHLRRRLEQSNRRVFQGCWMSRSAHRPRNPAEWSSPCYWAGTMDAPRELGPEAVVYGIAPGESKPQEALHHLVSYQGVVVKSK